MIGFILAFPYLGGLDERLYTPRKKDPRKAVPAGSVAIGDRQTGIYPVESPGGWQIIGRTPLKPFDLEREEPFLFRMGDRIRFVSITREEFESHTHH
jgi:KipI family sensor histidine kinase inhibitor